MESKKRKEPQSRQETTKRRRTTQLNRRQFIHHHKINYPIDRGTSLGFSQDLQSMLYGFGDDKTPHPETLKLVEDIVVEYITNMTQIALDTSTSRQGKLQTEDIVFLIRKDKKYFLRIMELLYSQDKLKKQRELFKDPAKSTKAINHIV